MIIFYEGVPGSGKTYDAVSKIVQNLKRGRVVYTNIDGIDNPVCQEMIKCLTGLEDLSELLYFLESGDVTHFWDIVQPGSFVVIDEVHKFFNARDWNSRPNRLAADWCSTHRHNGYDVLLLTQRIEKCDTQIRTLCEWCYRYKKVNFFGNFVNNTYVCHAYAGADDNQPMTRVTKRYDKKIFACYKSYATKDVKELGIQTHSNILKHPVFIFIPLVLIAVVFFGYRSATSKTGLVATVKNIGKVADVSDVKKSVSSVVQNSPGQNSSGQNQSSQSDSYSLVGVFGDRIVLESRSTGVQKSINDLYGDCHLLELKRLESVTVSCRGEILIFDTSKRFAVSG